MKGLKSLAVTSMTFALLAESALFSHAISFSMFIDPQAPYLSPSMLGSSQPDFSAFPGIATTGGLFNTLFEPDTSSLNHNYVTPSVVEFGSFASSGPIAAGVSDTYSNAPAAFTFQFEDGAESTPTGTVAAPSGPMSSFDNFLVEGHLVGSNGSLTGTVGNSPGSGIPFSTTAYAISKVSVFDSSGNFLAVGIPGTDPADNEAAYLISEKIGNNFYSIWVDANVSIPPPNESSPLTLSGYVTSVPEPGSVAAMLVGMGVSGGMLLRRRNRRKA